MRPSDNDRDLSTIVLGTKRSPGVVTISGHNRDQNWDVKAAKGQTGASSSLQSTPVGGFRCSFYIVDDNVESSEETEFDRWESFHRLLESMVSGPKPTALPIFHPDLARNKYTEVSLKSIAGAQHDGRGGVTYVVDFIEYKPPRAKKSTGAKAKPGQKTADSGSDEDAYDPNAAAKAQLEGLLEEAGKP